MIYVIFVDVYAYLYAYDTENTQTCSVDRVTEYLKKHCVLQLLK